MNESQRVNSTSQGLKEIPVIDDKHESSSHPDYVRIVSSDSKKDLMKLENVEELSTFVAQNTSGFVGADLEILCQHVLRQYEYAQNDDIRSLFETGIQKINPSVMRDNLGTMMKSTMSFKSIGGMESIKKSLLTSILEPLKYPEKFSRFGLKNVSGILLYGAKTTIVKCLAGESKMTLLSVSSAEKFIVKLFNQARLSAPTNLFFDEIDTIVSNRTHSNGTNETSTLLTEMNNKLKTQSVSLSK